MAKYNSTRHENTLWPHWLSKFRKTHKTDYNRLFFFYIFVKIFVGRTELNTFDKVIVETGH